jgi:transposase
MWVMERRQFTREFKLEVVKLIRERGVSVALASRDLGVHGTVLRNWVKAFADDTEQTFLGHGQVKPERHIQKMAAAYFAKDLI